MKIGTIYQTDWDENPFRVIGFDNYEIFYDCLESVGIWGFSNNLNKKCIFYRTSLQLFLSHSKEIDYQELSEREISIFRPDLPIRFGRSKDNHWNMFHYSSYDDFKKDCFSKQNDILKAREIVLVPYGKNKIFKKGTIIQADNSQYFELCEVIWKAKQIQESVNTKISNGIGLYRLGFEKEIPSYYIGEYYDNAGILNEIGDTLP